MDLNNERDSIKILYVAPETLLRPETLLLLEQSNLACLAIDEAHCISEWGHDFRPEYRQLEAVRRRFPWAVCLALTATATRRVRQDICRLLGLSPEGEFVASFNRPNLFLEGRLRRDCLGQVLGFLEKHRGEAGIIYCGTRKQTDELCAALNANGWPALPYHAGLADEERRRNQERFTRDDISVMVATVAFGMGINKSNIRFVVHAHMPKDLESYYQEVGRAGRDGLPAHCLLLYSRGDAMVHRHFIRQGANNEQRGRGARLNAMLNFAEAPTCRRVPLLAYFGEQLKEPCGNCDHCARPSIAAMVNVTADARKFLSCVQATGQLFGPAHIIAVLRASKAERILARRHERLPNYGTGAERSKEEWHGLAHQFVELGLLEQDLEFGTLRLTAQGRAVLAGTQQVLVAGEAAAAEPEQDRSISQHDPQLFERLGTLRRKIADELQLPPYIVFSDRALTEMATFLPQTAEQFLAINGVGQAKLAKYGEQFLEVVREYCRAAGPSGIVVAGHAKPVVRLPVRRRFHQIGELFAAGQSLDQIRERFQVTRGTVVQNLFRFLQEGGSLDPEQVLGESHLSAADRSRALREFDRFGAERLAPVFEALGGVISYDELHLLRLYRIAKSGLAPVTPAALPIDWASSLDDKKDQKDLFNSSAGT